MCSCVQVVCVRVRVVVWNCCGWVDWCVFFQSVGVSLCMLACLFALFSRSVGVLACVAVLGRWLVCVFVLMVRSCFAVLFCGQTTCC